MRELSRSNRNGVVIHESTCRHARVRWFWADDKTDAEIDQAVQQFGYRYCHACSPMGAPEVVDLVAALKRSLQGGAAP